MRKIQPPDIALYFLPALSLGLIVLLVYLLVPSERTTLRVALMGATSVTVPAMFGLAQQLTPMRRVAFRCYYFFRGPTCEIEVIGSIELDNEDIETNLVLDRTLEHAVKEWRPDAYLVNGGPSRGVIRAGHVMVIFSTSIPVDFGDTDEYEDEEPSVASKRLELTISGYKGKVSGVLRDLDGEIDVLLGKLLRPVASAERQPGLVFKATLVGNNTFLAYHLQGVSQDKVDGFRMRVNDRTYGDVANIQVNNNVLTVSSRSQAALVKCASRYLATPDLANVDTPQVRA